MSFRFDPGSGTRERQARAQRRSATSRELARLFRLPDRWLAEELLKLARQARREAPECLENPADLNYDVNFVWQVIPEIARRLGATRLLANEATDPDVVRKSDRELREALGSYLTNHALDILDEKTRDPYRETATALGLISGDIANGNPVAFAMDRIAAPAPADTHQSDWLARYMREISRARFGDDRFAAWEPSFQQYPRRSPALDLEDDLVEEADDPRAALEP